tara:strand:- start:147 stop:371 length:225 start_codon:yes stop_codon:yes gene_type:complete
MGQIKSMLMTAEDFLHVIVDLEECISGCEDIAEFRYNITEAGGEEFMALIDEFGRDVVNYIIDTAWNDYWSEYV